MIYSRYSADLVDEAVVTLDDNIKKFKRYGKILERPARNLRGEEAIIGVANHDDDDSATFYLVFYPDGTFDRFEGTALVYRDGWFGPDVERTETKLPIKLNDELPQAFEQIIMRVPAVKKRPGRPRKVVSAFDVAVSTLAEDAEIFKKERAAAERAAARKSRPKAVKKAAVKKPAVKKTAVGVKNVTDKKPAVAPKKKSVAKLVKKSKTVH